MKATNKTVLAIYIFSFLTGFPSNLLAGYAFLRKVRQKPTPIDIFLLNLTVSDLFLLIFLPFKMTEAAMDMTWPFPDFLCPLTNFCFYSSIYLSTLFLMGVSVERYLCVAHPVKHKLNRRPTYAIAASILFWLLACSHCASIVYVVEYRNGTLAKFEGTTCYETFSPEQLRILLPFRLELCLLLFCLPLIITIFCYVNVIRILTSMPNIPPHKKKRAVGLALATLLNFAIAFAPYNISHIVGFIQNQSPSWRVKSFFLTSLNTTLDPIIFFFSSTAIRRMVAHCWHGTCCKIRAVVSPCCPCWCKTPGDNDKQAGGGQESASNLPSGLAGAATPTPFTTQHRFGSSDD
ncbi:free fatty acid receptor 2-like [Rhineura floridana]|uniref:free fatty acid receptor 2-like n=1 Tax=Rhineura floridana TaxID=261503 RepID=UPI002AC888E0|nr:free fatty acid receptor 2-like [Rhineura floridana]